MPFTKQDLLTFGLGLGAALSVTVGEALINLEQQITIDWETWGYSLGVGMLASTGRYLATRVPELVNAIKDI